MKHEIKAVLFDCDGTLVDSEEAHYTAWKHALKKHGRTLSLEEYYFYVGKSTETIAHLFAKKIEKNCAAEILQDKMECFLQLQQAGLPPIQSTVDFIHRLAKEKPYLKLGVASAARKEEILFHLRHLKIDHYFDVILSGRDDLKDYSDPKGVNKPQPYIYLHAAKLLKVEPAQCLVIEDSAAGTASGASAGCITVAVPNPYSKLQDFSLAHLKIESFDSVDIDQFLNYASSFQALLVQNLNEACRR